MAVSEDQLDIWCKQGAIAQSRDTYSTIKSALEGRGSAYSARDFSVFLQGSYGNDTNIYADSDVDIVIRLNSVFYHDADQLSEVQKTAFHRAYGDVTYGLGDFKREVLAHLRSKYGSAVTPGKKAIFIKGEGSRRDADVIVAAKFRRYYAFNDKSSESYTEGICFFNANGERIVNYPRQHSDNCTAKHQNTKS